MSDRTAQAEPSTQILLGPGQPFDPEPEIPSEIADAMGVTAVANRLNRDQAVEGGNTSLRSTFARTY
jgi:hypothetical protein